MQYEWFTLNLEPRSIRDYIESFDIKYASALRHQQGLFSECEQAPQRCRDCDSCQERKVRYELRELLDEITVRNLVLNGGLRS